MEREMKRYIVILLVIIAGVICAQGTNPNYYQPRAIVDMPNAGLLPDRAWMGQIHLGESGSVTSYLGIGLWGRIQAGVSYGAYGVLGRGYATAYPRPGFQAKVRPIQESRDLPAIVLGYDDQGHGIWDSGRKRYARKSPGAYIVFSKNWATIGGNIGLHLGSNYSFETQDQGGINIWLGLDKNLGEMFAVSIEYDAAMNDYYKEDGVYGSGKGYLNAAVKWSIRPDFEIEFIMSDCLINDQNAKTFSREVRLSFVYPL